MEFRDGFLLAKHVLRHFKHIHSIVRSILISSKVARTLGSMRKFEGPTHFSLGRKIRDYKSENFSRT